MRTSTDTYPWRPQESLTKVPQDTSHPGTDFPAFQTTILMAKVLVEQVAHTMHPPELTRNPEPEEGLSCHDDLDHRKVTRRPRLSVCPRRLSIALYFASYVVLDLCFVSVNWKGLNKLDYTGSHMSHDISKYSISKTVLLGSLSVLLLGL
jgi:hypothetical protein